MRINTTSWWRIAAALTAAVTTIGAVATAPPAAAADSEEPRFEAQVVAGRNSLAGAWPSTVALVAEGLSAADGQFCGGSLVRADWVLTAAHCVTSPAPERFSVLVGTHDLFNGGELVPVESVHVHQGWRPTATSVPNDIALVHLARAVSQPSLDLIGIGQEGLWAPGTVATLVGWGGLTVDMENQKLPAVLQEVQMPVVADATCRSKLGRPFDPESMLCAGAPGVAPAGGPDACNGDSGGPLMVPSAEGRWTQIGIVSWGQSCGLTLSAYTRIANFRGWIDATIGGGPARGFSDIAGNPHQAAIEAVANAGIAGGFPDGTYRPSNVVTRGQMATFLVRALDLPPAASAPFTDIAGSAHAGAIASVAQAGVAGGFGDGTYRPNAPVTRGQMATFLTRALHLAPATVVPFTDVDGNGHAAGIASVAQAGIATGFGDGTYRPNVAVNRGQMATFLFRALLS